MIPRTTSTPAKPSGTDFIEKQPSRNAAGFRLRTAARYSILLLILMLLVAPASHAQLNRYGGGLSFSTGIDDEGEAFKTGNPGLCGRMVVEMTDRLWLIPSLTFYVPGKKSTSINSLTTFYGTVDIDATYTLATEGQILFYGLGGVNLTHLYRKYEETSTLLTNKYKFLPGLDLGTGVEMIVSDDVTAYAQIKGVVGAEYQYLVISIGAHYWFSGGPRRRW